MTSSLQSITRRNCQMSPASNRRRSKKSIVITGTSTPKIKFVRSAEFTIFRLCLQGTYRCRQWINMPSLSLEVQVAFSEVKRTVKSHNSAKQKKMVEIVPFRVRVQGKAPSKDIDKVMYINTNTRHLLWFFYIKNW